MHWRKTDFVNTSVKFLKDHYEKASPEPAAGDRHGNLPVALGRIQAAIMPRWHDLCFDFSINANCAVLARIIDSAKGNYGRWQSTHGMQPPYYVKGVLCYIS